MVNNVVYDDTSNGTVIALNAGTGSLLWTFSTTAFAQDSTPIYASGIVYVGSFDNELYASICNVPTIQRSG